MTEKYRLDDAGDAVVCTLKEWSEFFEEGRQKWALSAQVGDYRISTVFLGMDHDYSARPHEPVLWETMVFCDDEDDDWYEYQERYTTLTKAYNGHERIVRELKVLNPTTH